MALSAVQTCLHSWIWLLWAASALSMMISVLAGDDHRSLCTSSHNRVAPTIMTRGGSNHKVYRDLWYHNLKWYAMVDDAAEPTGLDEGMSVTTAVVTLQLSNISHFVHNLEVCHMNGTTLYVDYPFAAYYDDLGHMAEIMLPTYSLLRPLAESGADPLGVLPRERVLLNNLNKDIIDWFAHVLRLSVQHAAADFEKPPPVMDTSDLGEQAQKGWLHFERVLVVEDRYTHPQFRTGYLAPDHGDLWRHQGCARYVNDKWTAGFRDPKEAAQFRREAYQLADWDPPAADDWTPGNPPALPRTITYLMHADELHPGIANEPELLDMLQEVVDGLGNGWRLRVVSLTPAAPFVSHVATAAAAGVLVARHGPLLGDALFLAPGGAVVELLPYKWEWQNVSQLYYNLTQSTGVLHHFAWRPSSHAYCQYSDTADVRYHTWTAEECSSRECLAVHARAGMVVDVDAVRQLMLEVLPGVLAGASVDSMRRPWPAA